MSAVIRFDNLYTYAAEASTNVRLGSCAWDSFRTAVRNYQRALREVLEREAPEDALGWWRTCTQVPRRDR